MRYFWRFSNNVNVDFFTSVSDALVCLIVTRLLLAIVAQMEIASPGTYPPRSKRTLQVTAPLVMQVNPILCSISQWNGCYNNTKIFKKSLLG